MRGKVNWVMVCILDQRLPVSYRVNTTRYKGCVDKPDSMGLTHILYRIHDPETTFSDAPV